MSENYYELLNKNWLENTSISGGYIASQIK